MPGPKDDVIELGELELAVRTHGKLSSGRDNAILFPHQYSATPSSLDPWIGPGRPLDPGRWFVICPAQLGHGDLTIGDDVAAQHRLVTERFGLERLELVLGFSMGAQQAYEWAVRFPAMVRRLAVFAGTARTTTANSLLVAAAEEALRSGLGQHARFWAATALSAELFRCEAWRNAGYTSADDLVRRLFEEDFAPMDPETLLCQLRKWRRADVSRHTAGDLVAALARIAARTFVVPFSHDSLFPLADCEAEQRLIPESQLRVVESVWGHYAWGMTAAEAGQIDGFLHELLAH